MNWFSFKINLSLRSLYLQILLFWILHSWHLRAKLSIFFDCFKWTIWDVESWNKPMVYFEGRCFDSSISVSVEDHARIYNWDNHMRREPLADHYFFKKKKFNVFLENIISLSRFHWLFLPLFSFLRFLTFFVIKTTILYHIYSVLTFIINGLGFSNLHRRESIAASVDFCIPISFDSCGPYPSVGLITVRYEKTN